MKIKPGMEVEYETYKGKNTDPYGAGVVNYAEAWANAMEAAIGDSTGEAAELVIKENAKRLSHETDTDGITGFMYGCAVSSLAHFWPWGDSLRRWHNLESQIGTEGEQANESGGVLNPAVLTVASK